MAKHIPIQDCARPVWHLSASYGHWSPYCREEWAPCNFQTFGEEEVTCVKCAQVADAAWGRPLKSDRLFRAECPDTHAQPRPFSPEPHQKSEDAAIALEHGKEIRNVE